MFGKVNSIKFKHCELKSLQPALVMSSKQFQKLDSFIKKIYRRILGLSKYSSINIVLWMKGTVPPSITLELNMLSLFWNIWNLTSPLKNICINILEKKIKGTYWITQMVHIMSKYDIDHPLTWLKKPPMDKEKWKMFCKTKNSFMITTLKIKIILQD